jgi:hypothetical protein
VASIADPGGSVADRVENLLDGGPHGGRRSAAPSPRGVGGAGEGVEVIAFGLVEPQRGGERVEHAFGGAGEVAAFHADVVVHGHAGEHRDFFPAQSLDPPVPAVRGEPGLAGGDPCPP